MNDNPNCLKGKTVLFIGAVYPEPKSSAAGVRILQLIDFFKLQACILHFVTDAELSDFSAPLEDLGVSFCQVKLNDSSFNDFVKDLQPEIVIFDRFMTEEKYGWRVKDACSQAMLILDMEDFHALRMARQHAVKKDLDFKLADLHTEATFRELASIFRCDLTLVISRVEMEILTQKMGVSESLLHYLPLFVSPSGDDESRPRFSARKHFVTIGNFKHAPNLDAVLVLKNQLWSEIRRALPEAELHIYGSYSNDAVSKLNSAKDGFIIKGRAEDVHETLSQYRVLLAPLRFGAGLKGKLLDSMNAGTPSITTAIGTEGIAGAEEWPGVVTENNEDFIQAAVQLYQIENNWQDAVEKGDIILQNAFKSSLFDRDMLEKVCFLQQNLNSLRQSNFIGAMLQQHAFNATKYMSKWIEEKNRNLI